MAGSAESRSGYDPLPDNRSSAQPRVAVQAADRCGSTLPEAQKPLSLHVPLYRWTLYWLPRCVRHVRTSPCGRCATCSRRCANRRPVDVRRGIRPLSRRSSNERRDWELRPSGRRRSLSAAAIRMPCPVRQADECKDRGGIGSRFVGRRLTRVSGSRDASWHRTSTHEHQNAPYERRGIRRRLSTCAFEEGRFLRHLRSHS